MSSLTVQQKNVLAVLFAIVTVVGAIYIHHTLATDVAEQQELRKNAACPSLLSIARSSRDTLIVMKNEPLCATFVLDNLQ